jgi:hypothetical protein
MDVTDLGMVMDEREEHLSKHLSPIEVREFGIIIERRDEHPEKQ